MGTISSSPSVTNRAIPPSQQHRSVCSAHLKLRNYVGVKPHFLFSFLFFNSEALPGEMPPEQVGDYTSLCYKPRYKFWICFAMYAEE